MMSTTFVSFILVNEDKFSNPPLKSAKKIQSIPGNRMISFKRERERGTHHIPLHYNTWHGVHQSQRMEFLCDSRSSNRSQAIYTAECRGCNRVLYSS